MQLEKYIKELEYKFKKSNNINDLINLITVKSINDNASFSMIEINNIDIDSELYKNQKNKVEEMIYKINNNIDIKEAKYYIENIIYNEYL